jgi:hypothetical protein
VILVNPWGQFENDWASAFGASLFTVKKRLSKLLVVEFFSTQSIRAVFEFISTAPKQLSADIVTASVLFQKGGWSNEILLPK